MEKTIKIRSSFLSVLNEALQKLKINDTVKDFTPVIVEADGKFTSVVKTENEFDPSVFGANIDTEEDESENDTQRKETREQLLNKAKDAMKQTISSSSELKDILKKIEELSKSDDDKWQLNKEHNTASLPARNTYIFKQNNNLCLSHKGKIELFKSVQELRKWLKDNHYPLPDDTIVIHESVDLAEKSKPFNGQPNEEFYGKHGNNSRNWVNLYNAYKNEQITKGQAEIDANPKADIKRAPSAMDQALGKRVPKEVLQADMHKKEEPKVSNKYLNFDDDMEECFGGGVTGVSNLGSVVQYTASRMKNKEKKEELEEALNEDFPDFNPQTEDDPNVLPRGQGGKLAEKFINNLKRHPEIIQYLKDGKYKALPYTKDDYWTTLQSLFYEYGKTHVGNSNWPQKVKIVLQEEAKDLLKRFENGEVTPVESEVVSAFLDAYANSGVEVTEQGAINGLALALDDIFRKNQPKFAEFNQNLATKLNEYLNKDFGEIKVAIKPGDILLYQKTAKEKDDLGDDVDNAKNKRVVYSLNKHIGNEKKDANGNIIPDEDVGNIQARKDWNTENFKLYMAKTNTLDIFKKLYDALYSPDSKAKFAKDSDIGVKKWFASNDKSIAIDPTTDRRTSLLSDEEINEIKASWEEKKAEIKQEQPMSKPAPQEIQAEIKQEDELSDNEKKALDMLMMMNPNLDVSKLTNAQIREKLSKAMAVFGESKQESIYESAMKHPWLNKIMNRSRLVEDDSPADFASGSPISSDMDSSSVDTSSTTSTDTSSTTPDVDLDGAAPTAPNGFGDIDISVNGYDPEGEGDEGEMPAAPAQEFEIIDVLANNDDPTDIKVKVQDTETKETKILNLNEI